MSAEQVRLDEAHSQKAPWKKWGPYLSERQWGTVREDYSEAGNAWDYFSHDQARSRAYRWGEDGLAGISDDQQFCFALALWNGKDPILKHMEADEFYAGVIPKSLSADQANVMRQALAGMLWTKQFYHCGVAIDKLRRELSIREPSLPKSATRAPIRAQTAAVARRD